MPKIKTHKTASKRVTVTASGALRRRKAGQSHKMTNKSSAKKRSMRKGEAVAHADIKRLRKLLVI